MDVVAGVRCPTRKGRRDVRRVLCEPMVDVSNREVELEGVREPVEHIEQAGRVGPPRDRDDNGVALIEHAVSHDRVASALDDVEPRPAELH